MRIAITTVSFDGYNKSSWNEQRMTVYRAALVQAKHKNVDLLCLPGGYFYCPPDISSTRKNPCVDKNLEMLATYIIQLAQENQMGIVIGIDSSGDTSDVGIREGILPSCALGWSPSEKVLHCWNQRSSNSQDQYLAPQKSCDETRSIIINSQKIEVLICGELFNKRIRSAIIGRADKPTAVVNLVHKLVGFRSTGSLMKYSSHGIHAFCTGHADKPRAMKRYYAPSKRNRSSSDVDFEVGQDPRLEARIWSI